MGSVKLKDLKTYVRYDGSGRVVAGSLVFRKKKPKNGRWVEITKNECCNIGPNPTTTTTTTQGGGVTPTAWVAQAADRNFDSALRACNNPDAIILLYTSTNTFPIPPNTPLYTDASLTILISTTYPDYANVSINNWVFSVQGNGYTNAGEPCSSVTTTTTTTISATTYNLKSGQSQFNVCSGSVNLTVYAFASSLGVGVQLYTNINPLIQYNPGTTILVGFGSGIDDPVWEVNASGLIVSQYGAC